MSFGNAFTEVTLNEYPTSLIVGRNGFGKSSLATESVYFALFGKSYRKVTKEQLVNSINKKQCVVELEFNDERSDYLVRRGINPDIFEIYRDGEMIKQEASIKDYQKMLEQTILKFSAKTFVQVVLLGTGSYTPFMQLDTYLRREIIEDLLDIKMFSVMNIIIKAKLNETKIELDRINAVVEQAKLKVKHQKEIIAAKEQSKESKKGLIQGKLDSTIHSEHQLMLAIEALTSGSELLQTQLGEYGDLHDKLDVCRDSIRELQREDKELRKKVKFFSDKEECPECSQGISHVHRSSKVDGMNSRLSEITSTLATLGDELDALMVRDKERNKLTARLSDVSMEISVNQRYLLNIIKQKEELESDMKLVEEASDDVEEERGKLKEIASKAMELLKRKEELVKKKQTQEIAVLLLKDSGIKATIIKEYLPVINKLINRYLGTFEFFAQFHLDESFKETIKSRGRDTFSYENFSAGERQRIDLAILFTWREVAAMKNSLLTNLLVLDESLDASLDAAGSELVSNVVNELPNTNTLIVSHKGDMLTDKFSNVITIDKRGNFSVIV